MLWLTVDHRRPERKRLLRCASVPPTALADPIASFLFIIFCSLWSERVCFLSCAPSRASSLGLGLDLLATSQPWLKGFISELMAGWMTGQIVNPRDKPLLFESPEASEVKQTVTVFVQHSQQHRGRGHRQQREKDDEATILLTQNILRSEMQITGAISLLFDFIKKCIP